jgi:hypothetical protein
LPEPYFEKTPFPAKVKEHSTLVSVLNKSTKKSYKGNILGIGQNKFQNPYFSQKRTEDRTRAGGGQGLPTQ